MKFAKSIIFSLFVLVAFASVAQKHSAVRYYPRTNGRGFRNEIYIPNVMGYNVYKADLHTHSIYSDGDLTPELRVREAWVDGLDIISVTDHMEYRRIERDLVHFMKGYLAPEYRKEGKAINEKLLHKGPDSRGVLVDFNLGYKTALREAKKLGITVINGVEITRGKLGDYNALFTTDNNAIYDPNLEKTIRNARAQGAFIFHNHPQLSKKTASTMPLHCEDLHAKGLIDGFEIANGFVLYDRLIDYCLKGGYAPFANSDAHGLVAARFPNSGKEYYRNMTLILAKDKTEESIKEALKAKRTIAYTVNMLIGKEELLQELFKACVEVQPLGVSGKIRTLLLKNNSSLPFAISLNGKREYTIYANSTTLLEVGKSAKAVKFSVTNMLCGKDLSPVVSYKLK